MKLAEDKYDKDLEEILKFYFESIIDTLKK